MTRRLPPFGPLIAFDAVARHRSFTRAADELGVTQSAVSHQVRRLEDFLGVQLLKRLHPGVELSDDGARLQGELATLLDGIAGLEPSLRRRPGRATLRLGAGSSLAAWWLVRRLRTFRALHSEIEIDFVPVESEAVGEPSLTAGAPVQSEAAPQAPPAPQAPIEEAPRAAIVSAPSDEVLQRIGSPKRRRPAREEQAAATPAPAEGAEPKPHQ